ncbi:SET domain-containing protein [Patellaria atrata CBS 101060]|uniref:SET domain-containing protein n=1 Tax=Patellaria atrata CBS 101060 TaxID=1346257 RepID=A0A9P4SCC3_9PEZI|nr:SET domain-containing protein [Patellaria atrata CBS 101060]
MEDSAASTPRDSVPASTSSTPPTSQESASIASDAPKDEKAIERRSTRVRHSVATYNLSALTGNAKHTPVKYLKDKNVGGETAAGDHDDDNGKLLKDSEKVLNMSWSLNALPEIAANEAEQSQSQGLLRRKSTRLDTLTKAFDAVTLVASGLTNVLKDKKPNLRARESTSNMSSPEKRDNKAKKARFSMLDLSLQAEEEACQPAPPPKRQKRWVDRGQFLGQEVDFKSNLTEARNKSRRASKLSTTVKVNRTLPLPMFSKGDFLNTKGNYEHVFKNFVLPYDVFNPQPHKVKVPDWKKMSKNRFVGEAQNEWKKAGRLAQSLCHCVNEDGCDERCINRAMSYECDRSNCAVGPELCTNRQFANLKRRIGPHKHHGVKPSKIEGSEEKIKKDLPSNFSVGIEVMETENRGYGIRAMRPFAPGQIVTEYCGEIITMEECERRMRTEYKNNPHYYLMTLDKGFVIDGTVGSMARFVNHSCEPNCEMQKWIVNGEPRMGLFAGNRGIMTGEELTYDYNFDPFSDKNVQVCRCGAQSCRGFLGPRPNKESFRAKQAVEAVLGGAKRKLQQAFGRGGSSKDAETTVQKSKKGSADSVTVPKAKSLDKEDNQKQTRDARAARRSLPSTSSRRVIAPIRRTSSVVVRRQSATSRARNSMGRFATGIMNQTDLLKTARQARITSRRSLLGAKTPQEKTSDPLIWDVPSDRQTPERQKNEDGDEEDEPGVDLLADSPVRSTRSKLARPTISPSVKSKAQSMKHGVVKSVKGQRRAAAVAKYRLKAGGDGLKSGRTIRTVFTED